MLLNLQKEPEKPVRVIVIGGNGFIGRAIISRLRDEGVETIPITRDDGDLSEPSSVKKIAKKIENSDVVIAAAAAAPAKNLQDFEINIKIMRNIFSVVKIAEPAHLINISSDAVYGDLPLPLNEDSPKAPFSFHGLMHLTRELTFSSLALPMMNLRPTLVYGPSDPHNGYGPNKFGRAAMLNEDIALFGNGDERRDHVYVEDVAELVKLATFHKSVGCLNAVTGEVWSFREIASMVIEITQSNSKIVSTQRSGPMPHNGLRTFDNSAVYEAFPNFQFVKLPDGLKAFIA
jgi:nucleoside-diphosphate-sugar epimerase